MAVKRPDKNVPGINSEVQVEVPDLDSTPVAEGTESVAESPVSVAESPTTTAESTEDPAPTEDTTFTEGDAPTTPDVSGVTVDPESLNVKEDSIPTPPEGKVRIRMRVDHHCVIAMERYDFKAGQTYLVPPNVKRIMNDKGYLSPL